MSIGIKVDRKKSVLRVSVFTLVDCFIDMNIYIVKYFFSLANNLISLIKINLFSVRNDFYKKLTHIFIIFVTFILATGGIVQKALSSNNLQALRLSGSGIQIGFNDALYQGVTKNASENKTFAPLTGVKTLIHEVTDGETLESISERYGVSIDTIRWASMDTGLSPFTNEIKIGMKLTIPEINGVLAKVNPGDTIEKILQYTNLPVDEANFANVAQLNNIDPPYNLDGRNYIFIPNGNIKVSQIGPLKDIPRGVFSNPLGHESCTGYAFSRGFTSYHPGVDLAKWDGCIITAVANGVVTYAGWSNYGEGYNVRIDHGGGIVTHYYHGNGDFYVKKGDKVLQKQQIMYMGNTGNSYGTHLHFAMFKDGVAVDPNGYVPY